MEQNEALLDEGNAVEDDAFSTELSAADAEGMDAMAALLDEEELSLSLPKSGQSRTGVIVGVKEDEVLVSIGAKSEGIIPGKELAQLSDEEKAELEMGKDIHVFVVTPEDQHGNLVLSYTRALEESDWDLAESLHGTEEIYEGTVSGYNKGGLIVRMGRLRGFVPASQVSLSRRMAYGGNTPDGRWSKMVGQEIIVRVIEVDRGRRRLIFSEMAALQESREIFKERLLSEISVGDVLDGRVTSLADFGAFVNINGADGLVHLTEISWDRIRHPSQILKVGEEVRVKVIKIDVEAKRIGLSIRQLQEDPWPQKISVFREGQLVKGMVVRLAKFGAFARLEETDLEGLIHISELSESRIEHPKEVVSEDETLTLRIIRIDVDQRRIGLSLRKVNSLAYADLDLKFALAQEEAEEAAEAEAEEAPAAEAEEAEASAEAEAVEDAPVAEVEESAEAEVVEEAPVAEVEASAEAEAVEEAPEAEEAEAPEVEEAQAEEEADPAEEPSDANEAASEDEEAAE
jgi:small subunit ribosomal protein S1